MIAPEQMPATYGAAPTQNVMPAAAPVDNSALIAALMKKQGGTPADTEEEMRKRYMAAAANQMGGPVGAGKGNAVAGILAQALQGYMAGGGKFGGGMPNAQNVTPTPTGPGA